MPKRVSSRHCSSLGCSAIRRSQRYEEAITAYEQAIQIAPNYSLAWDNKGLALAELQRYEEAIVTYDQAIQANGEWGNSSPANAWYHRGDALLNLHRYEEAIASYDRAIQIKSELVEA